MGNNQPKTSISQAAKKWLNSFSDQVDFHRFQRGIMLFNRDHVLDMKIDPIGFEAVILGSGNNKYHVIGEYILDGYFPDINNFTINCNCPDDVPFCKHGVCAVCYLITYYEKQGKNKQLSSCLLDLEKSEVILDSFKNYVTQSRDTVLSLPSESFWPFESTFNEAMKDIDYVLGSILSELKRNVKE